MSRTKCLSSEEIENALADRLPPDQLTKLESHLETCSKCVDRMELASVARVTGPLRAQIVSGVPDSRFGEIQTSTRGICSRKTKPLEEPQAVHGRDGDLLDGLPSVGGYEIYELIGRGGMGVVYRALQLSLNRVVALKMISDGLLAGPQKIARFYREAEAIAKINHPNVVKIFDVGDVKGRPYFAMEWVEGRTLADVIDGTPWSGIKAGQIIMKLAAAVQAIHDAGVIHRDIKPSNVLVTQSNDGAIDGLWVTDFGLAKFEIQDNLTHTHQAFGTPAYLSPEQAAGQSETITAVSDVFSIGCVLYELLTGRTPFKASSIAETMRQIAEEEAVDPIRLNPDVPKDLSTICMKCLRKYPAHRYATANALAQDLERFLQGKPISARPVSRLEKLWKSAKRYPVLASSLMLSVMLILLSLGLWLNFTNQLAIAKQRAEDNEKTANDNALLAAKNAETASANAATAKANAEKAQANAEKAEANAEKATRESRIARENVRDALVMYEGTQEILTLMVHNLSEVSDQVKNGERFDISDVLSFDPESLARRFEGRPFVGGRLHKMLGITFYKNGILEKAIEHLEIADQLLDIDSKAAMAERFDVQYSLALSYRQVQRFEDALQLLDGLLAPVWNPQYPEWQIPPAIKKQLQATRDTIEAERAAGE